MILAERAAPTGAFDFEALTPDGTGRVLRYAIVGAADDGTPVWQPVPDEYAIGFPRDLRNGNGGVAIGYDYDRARRRRSRRLRRFPVVDRRSLAPRRRSRLGGAARGVGAARRQRVAGKLGLARAAAQRSAAAQRVHRL